MGLGKIEDTAVGVIQSGGEIGRKFALQYNPQTLGSQIIARIAEGPGINVGQEEPAGGAYIASTGKTRIPDVVRERAQLRVVLADSPRKTDLLMVGTLYLGVVVLHAHSRIRFTQVRRG